MISTYGRSLNFDMEMIQEAAGRHCDCPFGPCDWTHYAPGYRRAYLRLRLRIPFRLAAMARKLIWRS